MLVNAVTASLICSPSTEIPLPQCCDVLIKHCRGTLESRSRGCLGATGFSVDGGAFYNRRTESQEARVHHYCRGHPWINVKPKCKADMLDSKESQHKLKFLSFLV